MHGSIREQSTIFMSTQNRQLQGKNQFSVLNVSDSSSTLLSGYHTGNRSRAGTKDSDSSLSSAGLEYGMNNRSMSKSIDYHGIPQRRNEYDHHDASCPPPPPSLGISNDTAALVDAEGLGTRRRSHRPRGCRGGRKNRKNKPTVVVPSPTGGGMTESCNSLENLNIPQEVALGIGNMKTSSCHNINGYIGKNSHISHPVDHKRVAIGKGHEAGTEPRICSLSNNGTSQAPARSRENKQIHNGAQNYNEQLQHQDHLNPSIKINSENESHRYHAFDATPYNYNRNSRNTTLPRARDGKISSSTIFNNHENPSSGRNHLKHHDHHRTRPYAPTPQSNSLLPPFLYKNHNNFQLHSFEQLDTQPHNVKLLSTDAADATRSEFSSSDIDASKNVPAGKMMYHNNTSTHKSATIETVLFMGTSRTGEASSNGRNKKGNNFFVDCNQFDTSYNIPEQPITSSTGTKHLISYKAYKNSSNSVYSKEIENEGRGLSILPKALSDHAEVVDHHSRHQIFEDSNDALLLSALDEKEYFITEEHVPGFERNNSTNTFLDHNFLDNNTERNPYIRWYSNQPYAITEHSEKINQAVSSADCSSTSSDSSSLQTGITRADSTVSSTQTNYVGIGLPRTTPSHDYRKERIEKQRRMMANGGSLFVTSPRSFLFGGCARKHYKELEGEIAW
jgi:hypothetical protein